MYISESIEAYFHTLAEKILSSRVDLYASQIVNGYENNGSDVTTQGIRITTRSVFVPQVFMQGQWLWAYQVIISPATPQKAWRLRTRTWNIRDLRGHVETVDRQPGVIGLYPEIFTGSDSCVYESCCPLATQGGFMSGSFNFVNMENPNETVDAIVGEFEFKLPENAVFVTIP